MCILNVDYFHNRSTSHFVSRNRPLFANGVVNFVLWNDFPLSLIFSMYLYDGKINTNTKSAVFMEKSHFIFKKMIINFS